MCNGELGSLDTVESTDNGQLGLVILRKITKGEYFCFHIKNINCKVLLDLSGLKSIRKKKKFSILAKTYQYENAAGIYSSLPEFLFYPLVCTGSGK